MSSYISVIRTASAESCVPILPRGGALEFFAQSFLPLSRWFCRPLFSGMGIPSQNIAGVGPGGGGGGGGFNSWN